MSDGLTSPHDLRTTTIGRQQIILGDCRAVLRTLPTAAVDVIVTSPPYNIGVDYHQHDDHQPRETYLAGLAKCFAELHRVLKPAGSFFLNIGTGTKDDFTLPFAIIERALIAGFVPQNYIAWVKAIAAANGVIRGHNKPVNSPLFLTRMHEIVLHLTKSGDVRLSKLAIGVPFADKSNIERRGHAEDKRDRGNTWFLDYDTVQSSKVGKFDHPAGFPAELPTWCIRLHGLRPDLTVLDPFLGAGTTLVAAQALGCHGVGIEIDPQYVETAVQRLRTTTPAETQPLRRADTAERPVVSEATDRESRRHQVVVDTRSSPQDLLRAAQQAGAQVRLHGGQVEFSSAHGLSPELRTLLRAHRDEVWTHLGGAALDAPPLALLHQLGVQLLVPTTMREAVAAVAQVERDSDQYTAEDRLIGFDIETSALPGLEVRPFTKLKRNGTPAKVQPTFKGTAALDPFRSRIRLAQLYGGGTHAVVLDLDLLSRLEVGKLLTQLFARHTVVAHNVSFELRFLGAAGIAVPQYEDTMQAAGLLLGVRQRSLEAAAGAYLGLAVPKSLQVSDWSAPVLSPGQHAYAALDAIIAFKLWLKLYPELLQKDRVTAYNLQRDATRVAVAMVDRGITLDRARHQQQIEEWRTTLAAANR